MIIHRAIISATSKPVIFYTLFCYNVPFFNINRISIAAWSLDCKSEANWYWKLVNTNFFQTNFPRRYLLYIVDVFESINLPNIMIYFFFIYIFCQYFFNTPLDRIQSSSYPDGLWTVAVSPADLFCRKCLITVNNLFAYVHMCTHLIYM